MLSGKTKLIIKIVLAIVVTLVIFFFIKGGIPLGHYYIDLREFEINEAFPIDVKISEARLDSNILEVKAISSTWKSGVYNITPIVKIYEYLDCKPHGYITGFTSDQYHLLKKGEIGVYNSQSNLSMIKIVNEKIGVKVDVYDDSNNFMGGSKCVNLDIPKYQENSEKIDGYLQESNLQLGYPSRNSEFIALGMDLVLENGKLKITDIGVVKQGIISDFYLMDEFASIGRIKLTGANFSDAYLQSLRSDLNLDKWIEAEDALSESELVDTGILEMGAINNEGYYIGTLFGVPNDPTTVVHKVRTSVTEQEIKKEVENLKKIVGQRVQGFEIMQVILLLDENSFYSLDEYVRYELESPELFIIKIYDDERTK